MGTNYYHHETTPCKCCGRQDEPRHIGKSSGGWCFALHVYPDDGIADLDGWVERWQTGTILSEYGDVLSPDDMLRIITKRGRAFEREYDPAWLVYNGATKGPMGLVRRRVDGRHCVGHGLGTWDLMVGEFS